MCVCGSSLTLCPLVCHSHSTVTTTAAWSGRLYVCLWVVSHTPSSRLPQSQHSDDHSGLERASVCVSVGRLSHPVLPSASHSTVTTTAAWSGRLYVCLWVVSHTPSSRLPQSQHSDDHSGLERASVCVSVGRLSHSVLSSATVTAQ